MKKQFTLPIIGFVVCAAIMNLSCSQKSPDGGVSMDESAVSIKIDTKQATNTTALAYRVYVFDRLVGYTQYALRDSVVMSADTSKLPFDEFELNNHDYKFLFIATPVGCQALRVVNSDGQKLAESTHWNHVRLVAGKSPLSVHTYCKVIDMPGRDIVSAGTVAATLERIVGQVVFDFYRATEDDCTTPADIVSDGVKSVLDRVRSIEIVYSGITDKIAFDADNNPVPVSQSSKVYAHSITPAMTDFLVDIPQSDIGIEKHASDATGAVRIHGACMLPSANRVVAQMRFNYYDTTPACMESHTDGEPHTAACFNEKTLELNLPHQTATELLPVISNNYTVCKAGLRCDRVIDINRNTGFIADTGWDNGINL